MRTPKLHYLFGIFIAILCLSAVPLQSQAATKSKHKAEESTKERLVLMPLRVPEEDKNLTGAMETALVEGLQQKYEVFSGELVAKKAHEIFLKESRSTSHKECDETRCLQGIAESFQAELLAVASVTKQDGGYFLALSIRNIFDNKDIYSKSLPCKGCDSFSMVAKLKEIVGDGEASLTISPSKLANPTVTVEPAHKQQKSLAALPETRPSLVNLLAACRA
jgi:deoxycytidylate deaminase